MFKLVLVFLTLFLTTVAQAEHTFVGSSGLGGTLSSNSNYLDDVQLQLGSSQDFVCEYDTGQTPDSMMCGVSSDSRRIMFVEKADMGTDFGMAQATNIEVCAHSADATTAADWLCISHDQDGGLIDVGTGRVKIPDPIDLVTDGVTGDFAAKIRNPVDAFTLTLLPLGISSNFSSRPNFQIYDGTREFEISIDNTSNTNRLGSASNHGLGIATNGVDRLAFTAAGVATFSQAVNANGGLIVPDGVFLQVTDNNAGAPTGTDCDADNERGRISIDTSNNRLYICNGGSRGWDYVALTD